MALGLVQQPQTSRTAATWTTPFGLQQQNDTSKICVCFRRWLKPIPDPQLAISLKRGQALHSTHTANSRNDHKLLAHKDLPEKILPFLTQNRSVYPLHSSRDRVQHHVDCCHRWPLNFRAKHVSVHSWRLHDASLVQLVQYTVFIWMRQAYHHSPAPATIPAETNTRLMATIILFVGKNY